ncbi:MAG: DUF2851 family protein [Rikenellaceae bacterium]|nr:DUF2851 family protein [Rikenellaceae bacterium]
MMPRPLIYQVEGDCRSKSASVGGMNCPQLLSSMDIEHRSKILDSLWRERQERKYNDIVDILNRSDGNWNQTMHTMLLKFIGGFDNGGAAMRLAERVPYAIIMRERSSKMAIEALLLGASGLLSLYDSNDEYIAHLAQEYIHLSAKYGIEAMDYREWRTSNVRTHNHPTLRLAQLAACYMDSDITMNSVTECRHLADIYKLFSGRASEQWLRHFIPYTIMEETSATFGKMKCELLGINFVAQMIYAYGRHTHSEALCTQAYNLLLSIPAEKNRYTEEWNATSKIASSAIDSQALIQLSREYCHAKRCHVCPLGMNTDSR